MNRSRISYPMYKRNVFSHIICEAFSRLHAEAIELNESDYLHENTTKVSREFITNELNLNENTIDQIKESLKGGNYFVKRLVTLAEAVATEKMETLAKEKLSTPDTVELNPEEKELIDNLFKMERPEECIEEIKNSMVVALTAENKKADEIKEALDLMKKKDVDQKTISESVTSMTRKGPHSLLNAILTNVSESYVKTQMSSNPKANPGHIMNECAGNIKEDALNIYALYETMNTFGFKPMDKKQVEQLSFKIYRGEIQ